MKSRIRALPAFSNRGTTSTRTSLVTLSGPASSATMMPVSPPIDAPMSTTGVPISSMTCSTSPSATPVRSRPRGRGRCRRGRGCRSRRRGNPGRPGAGRCSSRSAGSGRRRAASGSSAVRPTRLRRRRFHSSPTRVIPSTPANSTMRGVLTGILSVTRAADVTHGHPDEICSPGRADRPATARSTG